ncbi:5367_t:CDS:2 [Paraglomus occultum]|uniref:ditrans,polycis-polyprenyl diphosphate synthase [(2E,6E)-farnesyldiphosphate specific] n=1 Tax=Paraglomus occultum TaxID=144539 RepID=A0A9N9BSQ0_9GLOM|nr:5367_t:CDS:2 [Paraglomus occultum]
MLPSILIIILLILPFPLFLYTFPDILYKSLLSVLHLLYNIQRFTSSLAQIRKPRITVSYDSIKQVISIVDRIPKHLAVIYWRRVEEEEGNGEGVEIGYREIGKLACWAASAGIKVLSIYEAEGKLKRIVRQLQHHVDAEARRFFAREGNIPILRVSVVYNSSSTEDIQADLQIILLSRSDGRGRIVEVTKSLASETSLGNLQSDAIDVERIDQALSDSHFTEPQQLIMFSPEIDLQGFPPWQLRLTEIFHIAGNKHFDYSVFQEALIKYAKIDKRFGR